MDRREFLKLSVSLGIVPYASLFLKDAELPAIPTELVSLVERSYLLSVSATASSPAIVWLLSDNIRVFSIHVPVANLVADCYPFYAGVPEIPPGDLTIECDVPAMAVIHTASGEAMRKPLNLWSLAAAVKTRTVLWTP